MQVIFIIIIGVCAGAVGFILLRKFPQLSILDVDNLPEEKEARKKREIIGKRVEEKGRKIKSAWSARSAPLKRMWGRAQLRFRIYVGKIERLWHHEQSRRRAAAPAGEAAAPEEQERKINNFIVEAEQSLKSGRLDDAEALYISVIKMDKKCVPAYRGLGDVYLAQGKLDEARQTFRFLLRLAPDDDGTMMKLGEIAERQGDLEEAIGYYQNAILANDAFSPRYYHLAGLLLKVRQPAVAKEAILQAVELEPKNPKYLDLLIEIAIICGDRGLAEKGYEELRMVNADNQKLESFKDRINKI